MPDDRSMSKLAVAAGSVKRLAVSGKTLAAAGLMAGAVLFLATRDRALAAPTTEPTSAPTLASTAEFPAEDFLVDDPAIVNAHRALTGKPAPAIKTSKWFGKSIDLSPEATKGKVVILDLWATWCVPCRLDMPKTDALAKKLADQPIVFASICSDGEPEELTKFVADKQLSLPMAWDEGTSTFEAFGGAFFPTYVAIDKHGTVRAIGFTHAAMEKIATKLLAE